MTKLNTDINNLPLVTIVTPSYNQGRFIRETIESVLSQDYPHIEYIVMDGGSTDETLDILKSYGHRLFWISEPDQGQAHAIDKGWKRAKGDVLAWLNSDDVYLPGAIGKAVGYLVENQKVGMVYGEAYHIDENGRIIERFPTEPFDAQRLIENNYISQPATFIPRAVVEDVGFLDASLHLCMDYDLWIRISKKYPLGYLPDYLAKSRLYADCKTLRQRIASRREVLDMLHRHYGSVPPSWCYDYALAVLERRLDRSVAGQARIFGLGLTALAFREFLRYNHRISLVELRQWGREFRHELGKLLLWYR